MKTQNLLKTSLIVTTTLIAGFVFAVALGESARTLTESSLYNMQAQVEAFSQSMMLFY